jgi:hypothetical protein
MRTVEFEFDINDVVVNTVTGATGVVGMCAIDDGGTQYAVKDVHGSQWWQERHLRHQDPAPGPCPPPQAG